MRNSIFGIVKIIRYLSDSNVKLSKKMLFLIPIIYLLFPFDLIGDFFPLAGQLDDIAVFIVMWPILKKLLSNYNLTDYASNKSDNKDDKNTIDIKDGDYEVK